MSIHRSTSFDTFIRLVDSELLREYLQKEKVLSENDTRELTVDSVHKILSAMGNKIKSIDIEDDLLSMHDITDKALYGLHEIARKYGIKVQDNEAPQNIAMKVFLHSDPKAFDSLYDSYICKACYDNLSYYPLKAEKADYGAEAFDLFQKEIATALQCQKQDECIVRHHEYKSGQYVLVTRLDKMHSYRTLEAGRVRPRLYRPAKEDAICYDQNRGVIGVSSGFRSSIVKKLCVRAFAKAVLKVPVVDEKAFSSENGLMDLAPLKKEKFYVKTEQIKVELLCAEYAHKATHLADICISSDDVRTTVKELSFPEANCEFISAKVRFTLKDQSRTQTVHITKKGFTALKNHAARDIIEAYLRDQKVVLF